MARSYDAWASVPNHPGGRPAPGRAGYLKAIVTATNQKLVTEGLPHPRHPRAGCLRYHQAVIDYGTLAFFPEEEPA